jgi:hypothetical protein
MEDKRRNGGGGGGWTQRANNQVKFHVYTHPTELPSLGKGKCKEETQNAI